MPGRGQGLPWTRAPLAAQPHGQVHESSTATPFTTMDCGHRYVCLALPVMSPRTVATPCKRDVVARHRMTPKEKLPLGCCHATTMGRRRPWPLRTRHAAQAATLPWTDLSTPAAFLLLHSSPLPSPTFCCRQPRRATRLRCQEGEQGEKRGWEKHHRHRETPAATPSRRTHKHAVEPHQIGAWPYQIRLTR